MAPVEVCAAPSLPIETLSPGPTKSRIAPAAACLSASPAAGTAHCSAALPLAALPLATLPGAALRGAELSCGARGLALGSVGASGLLSGPVGLKLT